ncbi:MAG: putative quinol monooxygenase [Janthinobacterium lividum]
MSDEIRVVAVLQGKPGTSKALGEALQRCVASSRLEAGCHFYTAHQDLADADRIVVIERWASQQALDAHKQTPHYLALGGEIGDLVAAAPQVSVLRSLGDA